MIMAQPLRFMHQRYTCFIRNDIVRAARFSQKLKVSPESSGSPETRSESSAKSSESSAKSSESSAKSSESSAMSSESSAKSSERVIKPVKFTVKPFSSIPGPMTLPIIGSLYNYFPGGSFYGLSLPRQGLKKLKTFGKLVRETFRPGKTVLWVFDPKDMETLFVNELHFPERRSHLALMKFRKDRPQVYNDGGLLPTNGEEWWRLRREFQKGLSALPNVRSYLPISDEIIKKFAHEVLIEGTSKHTVKDFLPLVSRLFLELVGIVAFDTNLNSFSQEELKPTSKSSRLLKAVEDANSYILHLDSTEESWMKKETKEYKKFVEAMLIMEEVAVELVQDKIKEIKNRPKTVDDENRVPSLFEMYLSNPELDSKDVVGMAVDLLLAGIDTTAYTSCYGMYCLAKNQVAQLGVLREAKQLLGEPMSDKPITAEILNHIPYTRAVLKEIFRLYPISVGVGRVTTQDMVLSGYHIPAKTQVVTQNQVTCRLEKYFRHPDRFVPERWYKDHPIAAFHNPYLALPFGHGPRACIARRLAEQHLLTLILRICHSFTFSWAGNKKKPLGFALGHINKPNQPVLLSLQNRKLK